MFCASSQQMEILSLTGSVNLYYYIAKDFSALTHQGIKAVFRLGVTS